MVFNFCGVGVMFYRRVLFLSSALTVVLSQMTWSGSDVGSGEPTLPAPVISSQSQGGHKLKAIVIQGSLSAV
jgi:hypothetical protein